MGSVANLELLDLPVYSEDEVAWTKCDIIDAARSGVDSFVRRACLEYDGHEEDLMAVLALADFVNTRTCEYLKVKKVEYSWGLAASV